MHHQQNVDRQPLHGLSRRKFGPKPDIGPKGSIRPGCKPTRSTHLIASFGATRQGTRRVTDPVKSIVRKHGYQSRPPGAETIITAIMARKAAIAVRKIMASTPTVIGASPEILGRSVRGSRCRLSNPARRRLRSGTVREPTLADPSEKIVKEPGPGAPDRVMLLADLHPRRGRTVVLPPKQRSLEISTAS